MICEATIIAEISYGKYVWCGNLDIGSGFTLTDQNFHDSYGEVNTSVLNLHIYMDPSLVGQVDGIEIYNEKGGLFGYNTRKVSTPYFSFFKKLKKEEIGTTFKICFNKKKVLTREEELTVFKLFRRYPKEVLFEKTIVIQEIATFSDSTCKICLNDVDDAINKYISYCGHTFHMNCVWEYLTVNGFINPIASRCSIKYPDGRYLCCNTGKLNRSFNCPACNTKICK
jgi:hypothetical protein